jgi:hypothetical protein
MRKRLVNTSWHCSHPRAGAAGELSQVTRFSKNGVSSNEVDTIALSDGIRRACCPDAYHPRGETADCLLSNASAESSLEGYELT